MQRQGTTRGIALAVLVAAAVAGSLVVLGVRPDSIASHYRDTLSSAGFVVWLSGLMVATLCPPLVAIACRFGSKKMRHGWLLHILLLPVTYAVVIGSVKVMLLAANEPDRDSLTGWATDPAAMLMLLCPLVYFVALGFTKLRNRTGSANVR
ncbi:hypothetical protein HL653_09650 [Sphingomonas sp. AP4-R1]|uniref:hypothetical protein n=1 Tax=Sphingomonas sp. AP4-R1 TaxID=2735134 RepID=UPI0014936D5A|nr:hypothetical protein [Sphingomonas sp. AP4-R1]QJU58027.1 hypothetical protein HL653_09650 [Sphingomonas sp. AP4-R1]